MAISKKVQNFMENASWIRKMFEQGAILKSSTAMTRFMISAWQTPMSEPPGEVFRPAEGGDLQPQAPAARLYVKCRVYTGAAGRCRYLSEEHGVEIFSDRIVMTCGAGGALNVTLKTILDPGDDVIVPVPYFVEYNFYIDNSGGVSKLVRTTEDFNLDVAAVERGNNRKNERCS